MDGRKEVAAILRDAVSKGWIVTPTGHGHSIAPPDDPKDRVFLGATPSDSRALKNIMARLRLRGWNGKDERLSMGDQLDILLAESAALKGENTALREEMEIIEEGRSDMAALRRKVKAGLLSVQQSVADRDVTITKLRRQVEDWRQKWNYSEKLLEKATEFYRAVARHLGMDPAPAPGCMEEAVGRIKKKDEHIEEVAEELASFLRLVYDGLDRVGAPSEVVEDAGVRALTTEERFATITGNQSAAELRLDLRHIRESLLLQASKTGDTVSAITAILGDRE